MRSLISLLFIVSCLVIFSDCWPSSFGQGDFYPTNGVSDPKRSESKTSVAIRDVIKRNSPRFRKVLVQNSNPDIVFSNADARMMTSRAKTKLDTLAGFVRDRFSTRLYVIKAWTDNVNIRDLSLHYEGRAVLVKLESNSIHLLDDVMIQALEAGFDWVWYKNHDSVHLSVIPDVCQSKLDLAIVVDSSASVGYNNFQKVCDFLIKLIEYFNVGRDETRISLINYSNYVNVVFRLNQYFNKHDMKNQIQNMNYINSNTATGDALITMVNHIFQTGNGMRDDKSIPKIGILMTDGYSNSGETVDYATQKVRDHGVSMFVIGVKDGVSMAEVNQVASPPVSDHYFHITTFNDLSKFVDKISTVSCDESSALSQCDNAETSIDGGSFKYFKAKFTGRSRTVSVEIVDKRGKSFLYTSLTLRNPGPLSDASAVQKSESQMSPRTVSVYLNIHSETLLYIAVQGQEDNNVFDLSIWDSLFSQPKITKSVREDVSVGTIIGTFQTKINPTSFHYRIRGGSRSSDFSIDPRSGVVKVARPLDREAVASYQFSVVAIDQSDKCYKGLTLLVINVIDANDNKPQFERSVYQASLREDTPTGQYVIQVKATDKDAGRNGELTYELVGTDSNLLTINSQTGEIRTKKSLDYEVKSYYEVQLRVHDNGSPQQSDTATLKLLITDVNKKPFFTNCPTPRNCTFTLDENKPKSTSVGSRLTAQDPDTKQNCALKFFVTSLDGQYFDIDSSGQIHTKSVLDREVKETYSLDIRAVDCGKPALHAQTTVIVRLNDLNDNRPVFSGAPYECRVPEGPARLNAVVCSVHATDKDKGVNAQIDYTITKTSLNGALSIDASGRMTLRKQLDRETQDTVILEVTAKDRGNPALSAVATVKIIVWDINDNKPQFQGANAFSIDENVNIGTKVTKLQATDIDLGLNGMVRFSIESGNAGNTFLVNSNGELVTRRSPDRETCDKYSLTIKAQDLGSPLLSNTKTFTININDLNDNRPVFKQGRYSESVKENAAMDTLVVKVEASDADIGINKQFVYFIANGDKQANVIISERDVNDNAPRIINAREKIAYTNYSLKKLLWLNVTDGDLGKGGKVNYKLLYTKEHLVGGNIENHVVVEVSDNGAPALSSNHTIVVVNSINCNAIHFSLDSFGNLMVDSLCTVYNLDKQRKLLVGQRLRLLCNATSNSDVRYRWSRDGDLVTSWSTNGVFSIQNVQQSDEASYSCLASSSAGLLQSTATKVIVYGKPRIVEQPVALSVNEKESATFGVKVIADPAPTYQWFKDDQPIKDATSATFTLEETLFADKALYHCRVSNSEGSVDSEKVRLLAVERSKIVTITVKLKKNEKKTCFHFFPEDFERISSTILNKKVLVTKFTAEQAVKICKRTACSKNPCQNKGTCELTLDGFKCLCTPEWQGDVCTENRDECAQGDVCRGNSTCQDTKGSFTCECSSDLTGKRCQYRAKVCENKCDVTKEVCVPREINEGVRGASEYKCLKKSNTLTIVTKVDKGWNKNKKFDLESLLNRIIKTTRQKSQTSRRRRDIESDTTTSRKRRDVSDTTTQTVDFGMCTAHIINHEKGSFTCECASDLTGKRSIQIEGEEAKVSFILDCSDAKNVTNKIQFTNDVIRQLCSQLFQGDEITACGRDHLIKPPVTKVVTTTTKVQVVVKDNNGKTLTTDEALKTIEEKGLKGNSGEFEIIDSKIAFKVEEGNNNNNTTTIIIAVVACLAVLTIVVVAVLVVRRRRNKEVVTSSSVMHRRAQMMQSDASTIHLVTSSPYNAGRENLSYSASNTGHEGDGETFEMQPGGLVSK